MERTLSDVVAEYDAQFKADPLTAERALLDIGKDLLLDALQAPGIDFDTVRQGERLYSHLRDKESIKDLLLRYLEQDLTCEEEAWTRWHLTDILAVLRRHEEAVQQQEAFLSWSRDHLSKDDLLWVISDCSQAFSWLAMGKGDEWLNHLTQILTIVPPTPDNRDERYQCLRTAARILGRLGTVEDAQRMVRRMRDLVNEDRSWDRAFEVEIESYAQELDAYQVHGMIDELRATAAMVTNLLEDQLRQLPTDEEQQRLSVRYHNIAAPIYRAKQYDQAIPLFERAVDLGIGSPHTHLWLAASLWATTRDRSRVLRLVKEAAHRHSGSRLWDEYKSLSEFLDVAEDPEFEQAATVG